MNDRSTGQRRGRRSIASLAFDAGGTTLAMMAMALIPMSAMAGSAVDVTRLYVVKVRLQQACDAGALAGRKFMTGTTLDTAAKTQAESFFDSNFPEGWFSTTDIEFTPTATADNQVTATATATVPMAVMQMVGKDPVKLDVSCDAKLEISNADIMFVLDVTGSMNCAASDPLTCSNGGVEKSNSKIGALRTAVVDFYDSIDAAIDTDARLRFGFVPYSHNVNVGGLLPASYFVDSWTYQSREARMYTPTTSALTEISMQVSSNSERSSWCTNWGNADPSTSGSPPNTVTTTYYAYGDWGATGDTEGDNRTCRRKRTQTTTTYVQDNANGTWFRDWTYKPVTYDTSQFKLGNSVTTRTGSSGSDVNSTWNRCIEERETVSDASFSSIPADAYDLDIDLIPNSDETRWKPAWPQVIYNRKVDTNPQTTPSNTLTQDFYSDDYFAHVDSDSNFANRSYTACPKAALNLEVMTKAEVQGYVSEATGFRAIGGTYHDVGMIWGARLLSPTGIFAADNESAPNGKPISRHMIFMTDGAMSPNYLLYGLYGIEFYDRRVTDNGSSEHMARHNARFSALCQAVRNKNITIWVVAYAQTMTNELRNCATPGKAYYAANDQQLKDAFKNIAQQIADLRLSK